MAGKPISRSRRAVPVTVEVAFLSMMARGNTTGKMTGTVGEIGQEKVGY